MRCRSRDGAHIVSAVLHLLDRVEIAQDDDEEGNQLVVRPIWKDVDRPSVGGWMLSAKARPLAERLKRAIEAGAVFTAGRIATDVDGRTYVATTGPRVLGRTLNADLKRLGY